MEASNNFNVPTKEAIQVEIRRGITVGADDPDVKEIVGVIGKLVRKKLGTWKVQAILANQSRRRVEYPQRPSFTDEELRQAVATGSPGTRLDDFSQAKKVAIHHLETAGWTVHIYGPNFEID